MTSESNATTVRRRLRAFFSIPLQLIGFFSRSSKEPCTCTYVNVLRFLPVHIILVLFNLPLPTFSGMQ